MLTISFPRYLFAIRPPVDSIRVPLYLTYRHDSVIQQSFSWSTRHWVLDSLQSPHFNLPHFLFSLLSIISSCSLNALSSQHRHTNTQHLSSQHTHNITTPLSTTLPSPSPPPHSLSTLLLSKIFLERSFSPSSQRCTTHPHAYGDGQIDSIRIGTLRDHHQP